MFVGTLNTYIKKCFDVRMLWGEMLRGRGKGIWVMLLQFICGDRQRSLWTRIFKQIPKGKEQGMWYLTKFKETVAWKFVEWASAVRKKLGRQWDTFQNTHPHQFLTAQRTIGCGKRRPEQLWLEERFIKVGSAYKEVVEMCPMIWFTSVYHFHVGTAVINKTSV